MHDVVAQLKWVRDAGSQASVAAPAVGAAAAVRRPSRTRLLTALLLLSCLLAAAMAVPTFRYFQRTPPPPAVRFTVDVGFSPNLPQLAVSPDGTAIAFQGRPSLDSRFAIFVRRVDQTAIQQLPGTEGGSQPFWSPDGRFVGFFAGGRIKKVAISAGSPQDIVEANGTATWSSDGLILFSNGSDLFSVPAAGGQAKRVGLDAVSQLGYPHFLPDGRHFLYTTASPPGIYVASLDSPHGQLVVSGLSSAGYVNPGYVLFVRQATLFAQRLDTKAWTPVGDPLFVADRVFMNVTGRAAFSASPNGVLAYRSALTFGTSQFTWYNRDGKPLGTIGKPGWWT
jgi:hypothetical protein